MHGSLAQYVYTVRTLLQKSWCVYFKRRDARPSCAHSPSSAAGCASARQLHSFNARVHPKYMSDINHVRTKDLTIVELDRFRLLQVQSEVV